MPVHFGGQPADMAKLNAIAWRHGLAVVEDAAHALGAEDNGRRVGTGPNLTVFSFYSNKNLTTGEGGMVVTDRRELAPPLRRWALHGLSKDNRARYLAGSPLYDVLFPGLKANLPDVLAALGIAQMGRIEQILARRRRVAGWYDRLLRHEAGLVRPRVREGCQPTWHLYPVLLSEGGQERRDRIVARLLEQGIHPSVHFIPLPRFTFWKETFGDPPGDFPVSERLFASEISLPIFPTMTLAQVRRVVAALREALIHCR
jgi:dTDP-4-amino-4,6-dideoxygalactose transaminase